MAGIALEDIFVGGLLYTNLTQVSHSGTTTTTLKSYTLAANKLAVDGQSILVEASGDFTSSANAKNIAVYFGGASIGLLTLPTNKAGSWHIRTRVYRTGLTTQIAIAERKYYSSTDGTSLNHVGHLNPDRTLDSTVNIKVISTAGASNEVNIRTIRISWDDVPV